MTKAVRVSPCSEGNRRSTHRALTHQNVMQEFGHKRVNPLVLVDRSPIHGSGLFSSRDLQKGQLIGVYEGPVVAEDNTYVLWVEDSPGGEWTGYEGCNEMRFMNHANQPNAEMDGLDCYSLAFIPAGTEITIDYGWNDS